MKKIVMILAVLALTSPLAAYASNGTGEDVKDRCLLFGECPNVQDPINVILAKLQNEIAKGAKVYTPEEIAKLNRKLIKYEEMSVSLANN